jgi:hypothetical protein
LLGHYAELSEEIFYLAAGRCSFIDVVDSDDFARFVQSANQRSSNSGFPPGVDLRVGHIKYLCLREQEKLSDTVFSQILHCAGSVGVLGFLREYHSKFFDKPSPSSERRFAMTVKCIPESEWIKFFKEHYGEMLDMEFIMTVRRIPESERIRFFKEHYGELSDNRFYLITRELEEPERFKFLEDHYSELSDQQLHWMVDIIDCSRFLRVHYVELSNELFHWIVTKLTEGSSTFPPFPDGFLEKYDGKELSDESFCLMVKELRGFLPAFFPDFLENCYCELSAERFNGVVEKLKFPPLKKLFYEGKSSRLSPFLLFHFLMKYYSEPLVRGSVHYVLGGLGDHYRKKFFNTQILHFIPKDVCLTLLNKTYDNSEDHLFRSVILKIKKVDEAWFTYPEHVECYSNLSDKRFLLVVRWDPRQLDELPWEIATKERLRLIGILQESLDRIEARKAQIEAINFTLIQRVLACLWDLVK